MTGRTTMKNFVGQWYHVKQLQKLCTETLKKFRPMRKKWLQETSSGTFPREFFMFVLFFSFNLKLICTCEFFKKLKFHLPKRLVQFQLFENSLVQINSKLTRNRIITSYKHTGVQSLASQRIYSLQTWPRKASAPGIVSLQLIKYSES